MIDAQGRNIHYLRISVTDRCNLRCSYCMPESGIHWTSHDEILSYEEILQLVRLFAQLGFDRIRLTGGEPLVRKDLSTLVSSIKQISGINWVGLTTNGILLEEQLPDLVSAGLDTVNISLDTLDPDQYRAITRRDGLEKVLRGLEAACKVPNLQIHLNCVPTTQNSDQWIPLAALARNSPHLDVRFIELMPIGLGYTQAGHREYAVLETLEKAFGTSTPIPMVRISGPSRYVRLPGFAGRIGFISALSHQFCSACNRVRLTATGILKPCLQYESDLNLKDLLRSGVEDEELCSIISDTIYRKPVSHHFGKVCTPVDEECNMNQIGG